MIHPNLSLANGVRGGFRNALSGSSITNSTEGALKIADTERLWRR